MAANAPTWRRSIWTVLAIGFFLIPAGYGFTTKFRELLALLGDEEGAFTVMPILNYLFATLGFFFLLWWAIFHGMFRDVEKPKYTMLETERQLDALEEEEMAYSESNWRHHG